MLIEMEQNMQLSVLYNIDQFILKFIKSMSLFRYTETSELLTSLLVLSWHAYRHVFGIDPWGSHSILVRASDLLPGYLGWLVRPVGLGKMWVGEATEHRSSMSTCMAEMPFIKVPNPPPHCSPGAAAAVCPLLWISVCSTSLCAVYV